MFSFCSFGLGIEPRALLFLSGQSAISGKSLTSHYQKPADGIDRQPEVPWVGAQSANKGQKTNTGVGTAAARMRLTPGEESLLSNPRIIVCYSLAFLATLGYGIMIPSLS